LRVGDDVETVIIDGKTVMENRQIPGLDMDDLLKEFLIETNESLDVVDVELVRFEQEPNNAEILGNVFRLVHTIKGRKMDKCER